ncbi:hypothetical protein PA25_19300 [Pseudoalteromonas sp. A25]|uniref:hypothetical protein n=1 Tax=Pseudoalteromonas sp. A25 TaxID=116092 RepID=UPI001260D776|nr:hypothetical protein [Pseudoalteromonas sp. A25]BBN81945.1 hypothetical protein PA25_19300 [Pseudoalteromonas sp. A25]
MYNYAHLDENNVVIGLYQFDEELDVEHYILSDNAQLGDVYNEQSQTFSQPIIDEEPVPSYPVISLQNVNITSPHAHLVGKIWWVPKLESFTLTANAEGLEDTQIMIMVERVINATQPVDDIRFVAKVENGALSMIGNFEQSGNYFITAERLNAGLERIDAPFRLSFEPMEFDAYVPNQNIS